MENVVVIVGRPNVGKSSLFNRLVGRKRSLVHQEGGTTRDRIEARCVLDENACTLVDTGGVLPSGKDTMSRQVLTQVKRAIESSDLLLFVVDAQSGLLPLDVEIVELLRKVSKPVLLIANKADNKTLSESAVDFYPLGFGEPIPVSSAHGTGIPELKERLFKNLLGGKEEVETPSFIHIAVVGRPNVGKSSFLNKLLNDERLIVDAAPGTTRDPVDVQFTKGEHTYTLVDTAGIRRFSQIQDEVLFQSVRTTREMIQKSDVCLLLLDGQEGIQRDDLRILQWVIEEGRGVVLLVNKWDLVKEHPEEEIERSIRRRLGSLNIMPILFTSSVTGKNVVRAVEVAKDVAQNHASHFDTHRLNELLEDIRKKPNLFPGRRVPHVTYLVQVGTRPPRFLIFGSTPEDLFSSFARFLERKLRENFHLLGTPVRFSFRRKKREKK